MGLRRILSGLDVSCQDIFYKYYQQIVLINREDVNTFFINTSETTNRIAFNLKEGKTGYLFKSNDIGETLFGSFAKTERKRIPYYTHRVQVPIVGVSESTKVILRDLDLSDCFAAAMYRDGTVEIYGFNYGLKTVDYDYQAQGSFGGAPISMESRYQEYDIPYVYSPLFIDVAGSATQIEQDFCNLFSNIPVIIAGDFNDDFNNDFYIEES